MTAARSISVVIPTWNRAARLSRCLDALYRQTLAPHRFEVIVVDDGSKEPFVPRFVDRSAKCGFKIIDADHRGAAAARNRGARAASSGLLCFIDDDVIAHASLLEAFVLARYAGGRGAHVASLCTEATSGPPSAVVRTLQMERSARAERLGPLGLLSTCMMIDAESFWAAGGFDEQLPRHEDYELGYRLQMSGVPIVRCSQAHATEIHDRTVELALSNSFLRGVSQARLLKRGRPVGRDFELRRIVAGGAIRRGLRRAFWHLVALPGARTLLSPMTTSTLWEPILRRVPQLYMPISAINFWAGVQGEVGGYRSFLRLLER